MDTPTSTADHDLLIEVNANVKNLTTTITAYTEANNRTTQDHEIRIRGLEAENQQLRGAQKAQANWMKIIGTVGGLISLALGILSFVK